MISFALLSALSTYYFIMFVTPGPNNAMLTASGMKFGFIKTLPHLIGIPLGHTLQIGLTCFGLANLFLLYPLIQFYMKILCFLYLIYLGWKMIGSFSMTQKETGRPLRFYEASLFQLINPKAWTISSMAASGFLPKDGDLFFSIFLIGIVALIICPLSISPWAAFGSAIRNMVKNNKIKALIEYFLAILLLITAIIIVLQ